MLPSGRILTAYDSRCDFRSIITKRLSGPLETLHGRIQPELQVVDDYGLNMTSQQFYAEDPALTEAYLLFLRFLVGVLGFDFYFQDTPTIRFHFPVRFGENFRDHEGNFYGHHADSMFGHAFEEINVWIPLTRCYKSNALQISQLGVGMESIGGLLDRIGWDWNEYHERGREHFFAAMMGDLEFRNHVVGNTEPLAMDYGQALIFDSRCIHGPAENVTQATRVSLDCRIIPVARYGRSTLRKSGGRSGRQFIRGDIFRMESIMS